MIVTPGLNRFAESNTHVARLRRQGADSYSACQWLSWYTSSTISVHFMLTITRRRVWEKIPSVGIEVFFILLLLTYPPLLASPKPLLHLEHPWKGPKYNTRRNKEIKNLFLKPSRLDDITQASEDRRIYRVYLKNRNNESMEENNSAHIPECSNCPSICLKFIQRSILQTRS